jgi:penicillin-binding protein 1A
MRFLSALLTLIVLAALGAVAGIFWVVHYYGSDLPDFSELADYQPATVTRVYAGDGRLLTEFATEHRVFVPISVMPKRVIRAFLSAEDKSFYEHGGVNIAAIARALWTDLEKLGSDRRPIGASTITQQVARNFLLNNELSLARKIKEAILAYRMEKVLSKDRILELYLNEIALGNHSFGVAAAALNYFNKPLDELTVAEAAYLGALPKAPNNYQPARNYEAAVARRNWVIGRMEEDGYITAAEADAARAEPLVTRRRDETTIFTADYFAEEVRRELLARYGETELYEGGLSVHTTIDPRLQTVADRALKDGLIAYDRRHGWRGPVTRLESLMDWAHSLAGVPAPPGSQPWQLAVVIETTADSAAIGLADGSRGRIPLAELHWARAWVEGERLGPEVRRPSDVLKPADVVLVEKVSEEPKGKAYPPGTYGLRQIPEIQGAVLALDPHTGRVLAMSGGYSFQMSVFNRATQAMRQPGSAFKPFVYLTALEHGFTPSTMILDAPFVAVQGPGLPLWRPVNYEHDYLGPATLRVGLERSRNLMTARVAQAIGMDKVAETAKSFGIVDDLPPYLSMALGAGETTLLRLTTAYAMLDNGGKRIVPTIIDRVQDRSGHTIYRHDDRPCPGCQNIAWTPAAAAPDVPDTRPQVADQRYAYQMVALLEGVVQRGTAKSIADLGLPLAGKTGTTNDSKSVWFIGFTPDLLVGTYVGFDQPRELHHEDTGAAVALPIVKEFLQAVLKDKPAIPFRVPPGVVLVRVNPTTGRLAQPGERQVIWEPYIPGTEPGSGPESSFVLDGSGSTAGPQLGGDGSLVVPTGEAAPAPAASPATSGLY